MRLIIKSRIACTSVLLLLAQFCASQSEPAIDSVLKGKDGKLVVGAQAYVQDLVFFDPLLKPGIHATNSVNNIITFRINEFDNLFLPDSFQASVVVRVVYSNVNNLVDSTERTLNISYNKLRTYNAKAHFFFSNAYSVNVKVLSLSAGGGSTLPGVIHALQLENLMVIDRDYKMDCSADAIRTITPNASGVASKGELRVSWPASRVSEEYDLEWTFIENSALASGRYHVSGVLNPNLLFKNNATRVTITTDHYDIPLLYEGGGKLFFRVRGAQILANKRRNTLAWSSDFVADGGLGMYDFSGHETNLNWQSSTAFAEDGKRKSVVQYFDGSLKGRQTVTKDNTNGFTVVAETLYDKQGRPAIQVLPAPTLSELIKFTPTFNNLGGGLEYQKYFYDTSNCQSGYCDSSAPAMDSTVSGAARYYSGLNPEASSGVNRFIPNAYGFAFSETRYAPDNTGRIAKQGGVGGKYIIGSGHETVYYYGAAEQEELDALFGTEAGDASHYQKNMVRDANGQYSVSYVDMHGRTIATALAGQKPDSLDQLSSYRNETQTSKLLNRTNNILKGTSLEMTKGLIVTMAGNHQFSYSLTPESLGLENCDMETICYDCLYDLDITITDECNNQSLPNHEPYRFTHKNFTLGSIDTTCTPAPGFTFNQTLFLQPGSYTVSKKLTISQKALDYYRDSIFLPNNTCKTYEDFVREQRLVIMSQLGDCIPQVDSSFEYERIKQQILADLTPTGGQYADPQFLSRPYNILSGGYRQPFIRYRDEDGSISRITRIGQNGEVEIVRPQQLGFQEFVQHFQSSWAENLITQHPEYQLWVTYEKLKASHIWDEEFARTETYADAKAKGYLNPTNNTSQAPFSGFPVNLIDPLFTAIAAIDAGQSNAARTAIQDSMRLFRSNGATTYSIYGLATALAACPNTDNFHNSCASGYNTNPFPSTLCAGEADMAWKMFRTLYLDIKRRYVEKFVRAQNPSVGYPAAPAISIFPRMENSFQEIGISDIWSTNVTALINGVQDSLAAKADRTCNEYANRWIQQLAPCAYDSLDLKNIIIPALVEVCKQGSDINHPWGASSVAPASSSVHRSFEDVIRAYNQSKGRPVDEICNSYLIDVPKPYEHSTLIVDKVIVQKPDSCDCARIATVRNEYVNNPGTSASFSQYLQTNYSAFITQGALDTLEGLCNGTITCKFIPNTVMLPPALQCGNNSPCIDCDQFNQAYDSFKVAFPGIVPGYDETDPDQGRRNRLFKNYMNNRFGFNNSAQEYLAFMDTCQKTRYSTCDSLAKIVEDYKAIRAEIRNGRAAYGYRLTAALDDIKESMNGILQWKRVTTGRDVLDAKFNYIGQRSPSPSNPFYTISHTSFSLADSLYNMVMPVNSSYMVNDGGFFTSMFNNQHVDPSDFAGPVPVNKLSQKYYAVSLMEEWGRWRFMWGEKGSWSGIDPGCPAPGITYYYGLTAPKEKFLAGTCYAITNGYDAAAFYQLPTSVTTAQGYKSFHDDTIYYKVYKLPNTSLYEDDRLPDMGLKDTLKNSPYTIKNEQIHSILSFTLDSLQLARYRQAGSVYQHLGTGHFVNARLKMMDGSEKIVQYYKNSSLILLKEEVDTVIYGADCQAGFAAYYKSIRGGNRTFAQLQSLYLDSCGMTLDFCDTVMNCTKLNSLVADFQKVFVNPRSGYVDLPMRTFAGNKTPLEGPKGVFNVNRKLIGEATGNSINEVHNNFAAIWNADSSNSLVGTLINLSSGEFRLVLKPGQIAPCEGIIGQRWYQFDVNVFDSVNASFAVGEGSYIDFGDSTYAFIKGIYEYGYAQSISQISSDPRNRISFNNYAGKHTETRVFLSPNYRTLKQFGITHRYNKPNGVWKQYKIKVYHTDKQGKMSYTAHRELKGGVEKPMMQNLEGYWPQETYGIYYHGPQDSTMARTRLIRNFKQINTIQAFEISVRSPAIALYDLNFESFANNRNLEFLWYDVSGNVPGVPSRPGKSIAEVSGTPIYRAFPALPQNFPNLRSLTMQGYLSMEYQFDSVNFDLPLITQFNMAFKDTIRSYQRDTIYNQLARRNNQSNVDIQSTWGITYLEPYTSASLAARNKMNALNWSIPGVNNNPGRDYGFSNIYLCTDSLVMTNNFTEYINSILGTTYTFPQLQLLYQQQCGVPLNLCNAMPVASFPAGPRLCGNVGSIDTTVVVPDGPCRDSLQLITITATERYRAYRDSLKNEFNRAYIYKCLNAANLESFTVTRAVSEYHYTLYYYDQAGNLVKTISPAGVKPDRTQAYLTEVAQKRALGQHKAPAHELAVNYRYNSLNQVVTQNSPDGGLSKFWYDRLGRLVVSQNAKQAPTRQYSYTKYDALGRITEVGEKLQPLVLTTTILRTERLLRKWIDFRNDLDAYQPKSVTLTIYDLVSDRVGIYGSVTPFRQKAHTLRNRVSSTTYFDLIPHSRTVTAGDTTYNSNYVGFYQSNTEFSYDIHGNVDSMLNAYNRETVMHFHGENKFKLITYDYDLISGKVNTVHYNPGKFDEFYHRYAYDAENRLTDVYTTDTRVFVGQESLEEHEAHYRYYRHGPLARQVIGHQQVQGIDYAYTLQGWLKGVNSASLLNQHDMGADSSHTALDAYGYNLNYHDSDYLSISGLVPFPKPNTQVMDGNYRGLYNGNIAAMAVNIRQFNNPQLYGYTYDQLNRITGMNVYRGFNGHSNNWSTMSSTGDYMERVSYDPNGNIQKYLRQGTGPTQRMDSMSYHYHAGTNQLSYIRDRVNNVTHENNYPADLDDQAVNNYLYDPIGNLRRDVKNRIDSIRWNVYGKIEMLRKQYPPTPTGSTRYVDYTYDAGGHRIEKGVVKAIGLPATHTFYVRDAQGNVMAEYEKEGSQSSGTLYLKKHYVYGSSRLGLVERNQNAGAAKYTPQNMNLVGASYVSTFTRGEKFFELSNHLGNVLVTVSDKKSGVQDTGNPLPYPVSRYYQADVVTANDYYPFGMGMPGRNYNKPGATDYRFGFNGKENDDHVNGEGTQQDYGMRIYDPRAGRFLSRDPIESEYPWLTPYQFASNSPIANVDLDGLESYPTYTNAIAIGKIFTNSKEKPLTKEEVRREAQTQADVSTKAAGLTALVVVDVFLTKGRLTGIFLAAQGFGLGEHNRAKTEEGRKAQDERFKENSADFAINLGIGSILGRTISFFRGPLKEEINYLFRGTSESYKGGASTQKLGITSTTSDPAVATIMATNSAQYGKGIVQIALPSDLQGVKYSGNGNALHNLEKEIGLEMLPTEFANKTNITITVDQARGILGEMGIAIPSQISNSDINRLLKETPKMTSDQINKFYIKAKAIAE